MYLESSSQSNNAYYKRFGFEVKKDIFLGGRMVSQRRNTPSTPVRLTIMVREPRKPLPHSIPIKLCGGLKVI
jgi:hypothetical protein